MGSPRRTLGKYELVARIGEGGMAEVHLARQRGPRRFQKLVVVKTVHSKLASKPALAEALLDEARIAAMVKHPNVVDIYDLGEENGTYFIAMEYLEGESLAAILRTSRLGPRLDPFSTARIVADSAAGLHAAHELKSLKGEPMELVHQDVTPGNVIVLYGGQVKLVDFGVAKVRTSADAGLVRGKAGYLAPELFEGRPADRRSDVFALGVVLWESLTLQRLFHSATEKETFDKIRTGVVEPPSRYMPSVTRDLDDVCLRALHRDPDQRYPTARAMQDDLGGVLRAANWGGDNEPIARFMRSAFSRQIAARQELLRELDEGEDPRAELLEQIASQTEGSPVPGAAPGDGARETARRGRSPGDGEGTGEVLAADGVTPTARAAASARRNRMVLAVGLVGVAVAVVLAVAIGRTSGVASGALVPDLAASAPDAGTELAANDPIDAGADVVALADVDAAVVPAAVSETTDAKDDRDKARLAKLDRRERERVAKLERPTPPTDADRLTTAKSLYKEGLQRFVGGDTAGAIAKYQAALARDPKHAASHRGLGMAFERNRDRGKAARAYQRYLELAPGASDGAQIRDRLAKLR